MVSRMMTPGSAPPHMLPGVTRTYGCAAAPAAQRS
jgi:hypothetical protein